MKYHRHTSCRHHPVIISTCVRHYSHSRITSSTIATHILQSVDRQSSDTLQTSSRHHSDTLQTSSRHHSAFIVYSCLFKMPMQDCFLEKSVWHQYCSLDLNAELAVLHQMTSVFLGQMNKKPSNAKRNCTTNAKSVFHLWVFGSAGVKNSWNQVTCHEWMTELIEFLFL